MSVTEQLLRALPEGIVITGDENTRPFECDGTKAFSGGFAREYRSN